MGTTMKMKTGIFILFFLCGAAQVCIRPVVDESYGSLTTIREILTVSSIPGTPWIDDQAEEYHGEAWESHATRIVIEQPGKHIPENPQIKSVRRPRLDPLFLDRPPPPQNLRG